MEAYLPLTMSAVHGYSPALAGLPLTITALGWSAASAAQGRFLNWSQGGIAAHRVLAGRGRAGRASAWSRSPGSPAGRRSWPARSAAPAWGSRCPRSRSCCSATHPRVSAGSTPRRCSSADWVGFRAAHRLGRRPAGCGGLGLRPVAGDGPAHGGLGGARAAGRPADRTVAVEGVTAHFEGQGGLRHALERTTLKGR